MEIGFNRIVSNFGKGTDTFSEEIYHLSCQDDGYYLSKMPICRKILFHKVEMVLNPIPCLLHWITGQSP